MPTSEIITIGNELLEGSKTNTNATWLSKRLGDIGVLVKRVVTVGDSVSEIAREMEGAAELDLDICLTTGGLGPTPDDRTLDGLSEALGSGRTLNEKALHMVKESYSRLAEEGHLKDGRLTPARKRMAKIPKDSTPVPNPLGGAPAVFAELDSMKILCLPGIPEEMKAIFDESLDILNLGDLKNRMIVSTLEVRGTVESLLSPFYEEVEGRYPDVEVRSYPEGCGGTNRIKVQLIGDDKDTVRKAFLLFNELIEDLEGVSAEKLS